MTFLPATFVAAIVSTSFFNLSASPPTVSSYFWIFWVVSLALTALTLGVFFLWKRKSKEEEKQKEREAKARENQRGWEEGGLETDSGGGGGGGADGGGSGRRRRRKRTSTPGGDGKKKKDKPELVV